MVHKILYILQIRTFLKLVSYLGQRIFFFETVLTSTPSFPASPGGPVGPFGPFEKDS